MSCYTPDTKCKAVHEVLSYYFDFTDWLTKINDTISSKSVTVSPSGLTLGAITNTSYIVKQSTSSGVDGTSYELTCDVVTVGGETKALRGIIQVSGA